MPAPALAEGFPSWTETLTALLPHRWTHTCYSHRLHRVELVFPGLPPGFDGVRILQLSDLHAGSMTHPEALRPVMDAVRALPTDLIVFTGDLVNAHEREFEPLADIMADLTAPLGVFSTLGNHDHGDDLKWDTQEAKTAHFERLCGWHQTLGWTLLTNTHHLLHRGGDTLALVGVDNWGAMPWVSKYADYAMAADGIPDTCFQILLSHHPDYWDYIVRKQFPQVSLTLSGHTHGTQVGIECGWVRISALKPFYPKWSGIYRAGHQVMYVNRGMGHSAHTTRIGIFPEITLLTLHRA
jgi:hypothetical protein